MGGQIYWDANTTGFLGNAFYSSTDGVTWQPSAPATQVSQSDTIVGMTLDSHGWVAVSGDGMVYTSPTAVTFTNTANLGLTSSGAKDIAFGGTHYVVVGAGGYAASSTDAVNWTIAAPVMSNAATPAPVQFHRVAFDGQRFVAVCDGGLVATSPDGLTWSVASSATTDNLTGIAISSTGEMVAIGPRGLTETSIDAVHWTVRTAITTRTLNAVAAVNGGFVAVGNDGVIQVSTH